jgi:hypothetical protein
MRLKRTAHFFSRQPRQLQVEHNHAGCLFTKAFEPSYAIGRNLHVQTVGFEQALQRALHGAAVFHY